MTEYKKNYFEDRKLKYEKNHGVFIHEFMFTEFSNRILGQCNTALNDLQRQLDLEIARAKAEEERIEAKAHNELGKIYSYINPSSSAYEDALNSQEPLKYTELKLGDGDFLAENVKKDLNSAYNTSMSVLMQVINAIKENGGPKLLQKVLDYLNIDYVDVFKLQSGQLQYKSVGTTQDDTTQDGQEKYITINSFTEPNSTLKTTYNENIDSLVNIIQWILDRLNKTIFPYASLRDDTNEIEITTPNQQSKSLPQSLIDSYSALQQAHNTINKLYMANNADSYTLNDQGRLVKNNQQTKLISNYNDSLMNITQAINRLAKKVEDLEKLIA